MSLLNPKNSLFNSIIIYIILILLIIYHKPNFIYDKKRKKFKEFGMSSDKSIIPLPILSILLAIIVYIIFFYIEQNAKIVSSYNNLISKK
jgi:hypothetical protein